MLDEYPSLSSSMSSASSVTNDLSVSAVSPRASQPPAARPDELWLERLRVLLQAAAEAQAATDEAGVLAAIGEGVRAVGFNGHLSLIDPQSGSLIVRHAVFVPAEVQPAIERRLGRPIVGLEIAPHVPVYVETIRSGAVSWVPVAAEWLQQALPWLDERVVRMIGRLRAVGQGVCAPITDGTTVLGALSIWGAVVTEADLPAVALLGRHAGGTLTSLRLRGQEMERARMDGAVKLANALAHELNNELAVTAGMAELLVEVPNLPDGAIALAHDIFSAAQRSASLVARLNSIVRFAEVPPSPGIPPMMDIGRSTLSGRQQGGDHSA